ncbi:hypothetical protein L9F63_013303 [Diploptera punctata]|uniref:Prefoldin subunit 5 n=1 Tax=Diploptera punctata TaxID=6984 RepID=A0AAD8ACM8_DIPPU|nr:hypothetical protein L9F63_013303 [Diploptera punctata]
MAAKDGKESEMHQVDLSKLNLPQLTGIKQTLDQDSLQTLKMAQAKFQDSGESLEKIKPETEGKSIMVPLTGSMYVPGKLADTKNVIIDIGTGYFVTKDIDGAKDYFKRKVNFVTEQMEKIQIIGLEKNKIREAVMDMMEIKLQAQLNAQQQQRQQAAKS